jgi:hypothetical protein
MGIRVPTYFACGSYVLVSVHLGVNVTNTVLARSALVALKCEPTRAATLLPPET